MFIDHAAVYVEDLERGACFYEQYFDGVRGERYENPRTGFSSYFITFNGGNTRLEVMHNDAIARPVDRGARGYAHVAFNVGSRERVDELTAQLVADDATVSHTGASIADVATVSTYATTPITMHATYTTVRVRGLNVRVKSSSLPTPACASPIRP